MQAAYWTHIGAHTRFKKIQRQFSEKNKTYSPNLSLAEHALRSAKSDQKVELISDTDTNSSITGWNQNRKQKNASKNIYPRDDDFMFQGIFTKFTYTFSPILYKK